MFGTSLGTTVHASESELSRGKTRRTVGLIVSGVGLIAFSSGVVLGRERAKREASGNCTQDVCTSMFARFIDDARSQRSSAFQLLSVGALAMASGVAFYLTAPSDKPTLVSQAGVALGPGGIVFKTSF